MTPDDPLPPTEKQAPVRRRVRCALRAGLRAFTAGDAVIGALGLVVLAYFCATPGIYQGKASGDGLFGFFYLPGLLFHHTFDMAAPAGTWWVSVLGREKTGHLSNPCPIGTIPLWLPTYLLGLGIKKLVAAFVTLTPSALQSRSYPISQFDYFMAGLGSMLSGLAGAALCFRLLARKLGVAAARFGTVAGVLATPLIWYLCNQPLYQHACAFFAVTLLVERWDAWRGAMTLRRYILVGAIGGAAMLMRFQEGVWLLLPGLDAAAAILSALRQRRWRETIIPLVGGVLLVLVCALVFAPQLLVWKYFFGTVRPPQPPGHMRWLDPGLLATLFSTRGGLLPWSPLLYLVVPGLLLGRRGLDGLAWRMLLMTAIVWWVNASAWDHWASWTFGARRFTDGTVAFAAGLAGFYAWAARVRWRRVALVAVTVMAVLWNGLLMELVRQHKTKSSGAFAYPAATWVKWSGGPDWLGRLFDRVGFPFVQPVGWIYGLVYHVPARTFEGVVGNYLLERDCRIHDVVHMPSLAFADDLPLVVEGVAHAPAKGWPPKTDLVPVTGSRIRTLIPLAGKEPLRVKLVGDFHGKEALLTVSWNDQLLRPTLAAHGEVRFEVPVELVHTRARTNVLIFDGVPAGSRVSRVDFESFTRWWEKP